MMSFPSINPTKTKSWQHLIQHYKSVHDIKMKDLFAQDKNRADKFTIKWDDFYVDFSKNRITEETLKYLLHLAEEVKLKEAEKISHLTLSMLENLDMRSMFPKKIEVYGKPQKGKYQLLQSVLLMAPLQYKVLICTR